MAFHALVESLTEAQWHSKTATTAWAVCDVLTHVADGLARLPEAMAHVRQGKNYLNLPSWLRDPLIRWLTTWSARDQTPESILRRYDQAHTASWPPLRAFGTTNGVAARSAMALDTRPSWICVCFQIATSRNMRPKLHHGSEPGEGFGKACSSYITHEGGQRHISSMRAESKQHVSMHGARRPLSENRRSSESPDKRLPEKLSLFGEENRREADRTATHRHFSHH